MITSDQQLLDFVHHARQKGMDHSTIRILLLSAGWREKDIAKSLAAESLDLPVPAPPGSGGAKEAFQYLMAFTSLYILVGNVIYLLFTFLDDLFPDPAATWYYESYRAQGIRWSLAMLIVAAPLYFGFTRWINSGVRRHQEKSKSVIRNWLTYLTLFVAAMTMMIDGMTLVYGVLQGDLTNRFVAKVLVVMALATLVFCYYLWTLRLPEKEKSAYLGRLDVSFGAAAALVIGLAIVLGFLTVESPFRARLRRFDERRIADLEAIKGAIERHSIDDRFEAGERVRRLKKPLPQSLDELDQFVRDVERRRNLSITDPMTGEKYPYVVQGKSSYELCGEFSLAEPETDYSGHWNHAAGRHCFVIDVLKNEMSNRASK